MRGLLASPVTRRVHYVQGGALWDGASADHPHAQLQDAPAARWQPRPGTGLVRCEPPSVIVEDIMVILKEMMVIVEEMMEGICF